MLESSEIRLCEYGHSWHNHNQQWLASSHSLHPHPLTLRHSHARHPLLREHRPKGSIEENLRRGMQWNEMSEWMKSMNEWMEWMNEQTKECMHGWMKEWTDGRMHECMHEQTNEWINDWRDAWMYRYMDGRMNERTNEWLSHWINEINEMNQGKWNSSIQKGDLEAILGPLRLRPILLRSFGELLRQPWTNIKNVQAHDTWHQSDKGCQVKEASFRPSKCTVRNSSLLVLWLGYRDPF